MKCKRIILSVLAFLSLTQMGYASKYFASLFEISETAASVARKVQQIVPKPTFAKDPIYRNVDNLIIDEMELLLPVHLGELWPIHTAYVSQGFAHVQGPVDLKRMEILTPFTGVRQNDWYSYENFFAKMPRELRSSLHMLALTENDLSRILVEGAGHLDCVISVGHRDIEIAQQRNTYKEWSQSWQRQYHEIYPKEVDAPWCIFQLNCKLDNDPIENHKRLTERRLKAERTPLWVAAQTELLCEIGMSKVVFADVNGEMATEDLVKIFQTLQTKDLVGQVGFQARGKNALLHAVLASAYGFSVVDLVTYPFRQAVKSDMQTRKKSMFEDSAEELGTTIMPLASDFLLAQKLLGANVSDTEIQAMREFEKKSPLTQFMNDWDQKKDRQNVTPKSHTVISSEPKLKVFKGIAAGPALQLPHIKALKPQKRDPKAFMQSRFDVGC